MRPTINSYVQAKALILGLAILVLSACGSGTDLVKSGSGESGVGGTGISFVKGNVSQIDGVNPGASGFEKTRVSAGDRSAGLSSSGEFSLSGVSPSSDLELVFTDDRGRSAALNLGPFPEGTTATVRNVDINFSGGTATSDDVEVKLGPAAASAQGGAANASPDSNACQSAPGEKGCSQSRGNGAGSNGNNGNNGNGNNGNGNGNNGSE